MRFFRYFVHKPVSIQKCMCPKKRINQPKLYGICSKINQFLYTLVCNYMPNIRILTKTVLEEILLTSLFIYKMPESEKGNNSTKNLRNRFKS